MKKLKWEYCECGCHGSELSIAGQTFSRYTYFVDSKNGNHDIDVIILYRGFHRGREIGRYKSREDCATAVRQILIGSLKELMVKLGG